MSKPTQISQAFREQMTGPIYNVVALEFDNITAKTNAALRNVGVWQQIPYASANFVGKGAMTWTTQASNQTTFEILEHGVSGTNGGATMSLHLFLVNTTVGGTPTNALNVTIPNSRSALNAAAGSYSFRDNNTWGSGVWEVALNGVVISFYRQDKSNWSASTGATDLRASIELSIV